jgi:hypothetical protein
VFGWLAARIDRFFEARALEQHYLQSMERRGHDYASAMKLFFDEQKLHPKGTPFPDIFAEVLKHH